MIDTQAIRKKILDLALRGKLTEQRPEDGTAEELFQQIQAQKNTYIANKDTKKANVSVPISDGEVPFNKPESWKWVRLGEIVIIKTGKRDANFGSINGKYKFFTCAKEPIKCNSFSFSGEALLLAGNGDIGNISYYYGEFEAYQRTYVLQPYLENVYLRYLYYYLLSYWVQYNLAQMFGATIPFIRLGNVQNYIIALPPIAEQHRIVSKIESIFCILDTIDTLQSQYQDNLATLKSKIIDAGIQGKLTEQLPEDGTAEELYQQIQQEKLALEKAGKIKKSKPFLPITDEEKPFEIPENWKWVKLGNVITLVSGTDFKPEDYNDAGIGMPYMTGASNIENDKLIINRWTPCPRNIAHEGELLLVCKGSGFGKLVICNVSEAHIARQFMSIRPYSGVDVNYVKAVMTNSFQIIKEAGKGLIPGVDRETVLNIPLPLPPLSEQKRIVAKLEELLPLCEG
ncbi:MAG: restriction endonuclease subunit S [Candidatus Limiplasma sp.]|nr:restriction endonuclease subunit S [Candidatus Limiplasma sp.]